MRFTVFYRFYRQESLTIQTVDIIWKQPLGKVTRWLDILFHTYLAIDNNESVAVELTRKLPIVWLYIWNLRS